MFPRNIENIRAKGESITLRIGCSPDKRELVAQIAERFKAISFSHDDQSVEIEIISLDNQELLESTLEGDLAVICPDSIVHVEQIEDNRQRQENSEDSIIEEITIFAISPLVIAMRPASARRLGYPNRDIGWRDLISEAQENPEFKWVRPHIQSSAGILTAFAEFHAAADMPEELSEGQLRDSHVRGYVRHLERGVQQYGPSEVDTITYAIGGGEWRVDAFVAQERLILSASRKLEGPNRPVIIYPKEGTIWVDHPLVLLSKEGITSTIRRVYNKLRDYILSADAQGLIASAGFHAAGPHVRSYFTKPPVSPRLAQKLHIATGEALSVPAAPILKSISSSWYTVKRPAAVYLVVDVSSSMSGDKLEEARKGLLAFLDQFQSQDDAVGLIVFNNSAHDVVPIAPLTTNLQLLRNAILSLTASGMTALLDAVSLAYDSLHKHFLNDPIRAIVAMTDGQENSSGTSQNTLKAKITHGNNRGFPVAIFCLAYGGDAELQTLEDLSALTSATTEKGTLANIERTYKRLSTFV